MLKLVVSIIMCFIVDLYNGEIVGYKSSKDKTPEIILDTISTIKFSMKHVNTFHSDRGGIKMKQ